MNEGKQCAMRVRKNPHQTTGFLTNVKVEIQLQSVQHLKENSEEYEHYQSSPTD